MIDHLGFVIENAVNGEQALRGERHPIGRWRWSTGQRKERRAKRASASASEFTGEAGDFTAFFVTVPKQFIYLCTFEQTEPFEHQ